jgi:AraC-like DNA-binding protein
MVAAVLESGRTLTLQSFREWRPPLPLAAYVTCVWIQRVSMDSMPYVRRTAPNGSAELVCELGSELRVIGPQTGPRVEHLRPGTILVGVRLRPGAVPAVLGVPACELADVTVGLSEVWGGHTSVEVDELGERMADSRLPREVLAALEGAMYRRLGDAPDPDPIPTEVVRLFLTGGPSEVSALSSTLAISESQLRRRCEAAIGFGPKTLHRVLRFQAFLALAKRYEVPSENVAELAADAGYADQSHLSRESVRLAGRPPGPLLRDWDKDCRAAHDHAASDMLLIEPRKMTDSSKTPRRVAPYG